MSLSLCVSLSVNEGQLDTRWLLWPTLTATIFFLSFKFHAMSGIWLLLLCAVDIFVEKKIMKKTNVTIWRILFRKLGISWKSIKLCFNIFSFKWKSRHYISGIVSGKCDFLKFGPTRTPPLSRHKRSTLARYFPSFAWSNARLDKRSGWTDRHIFKVTQKETSRRLNECKRVSEARGSLGWK